MNKTPVIYSAILIPLLTLSAAHRSQELSKPYTDGRLQVVFRFPKSWTHPQGLYEDRTYFEGPDGSVQLGANDADTPEVVCRGSATHRLQQYGSHARIQSLSVQGRRACIVWPSADQEYPWYVELVVELPRPVEINGDQYRLLMLNADKDHFQTIIKTLRFSSPKRQRAVRVHRRVSGDN
jgi:hypothetical protein